MISKKYLIFTVFLALIVCNSCSGSEYPNELYYQEVLQLDSLSFVPMKHNKWKTISLEDYLSSNDPKKYSNTIVLVGTDITVETVVFPPNVELHFCGGTLKGNIVFNKTYLSGSVRLQGSKISGSITNDCFEAGWLCYGDGEHDDALNINQILSICKNIYFNKGTYLLSSFHTPMPDLPLSLQYPIKSHIGIYENCVSLIGEKGSSFLTKEASVSLCIYSMPNDIKNSTKDILIQGITFRAENNGKDFNEYMHTVKLVGAKDIKIENCKFFDFWGDAICLSHYGDSPETGERTRNSNVSIRSNYIEGSSHNNRNGISVISGYNINIENNLIEETSREDMPGAIDIEANNEVYTINHVKISGNTITGSKGIIGGISVVSNKNNAPAHNITIENNKISDSSMGIILLISNDKSSSNIKLLNNNVVGIRRAYMFTGAGKSKNWTIHNNYNNGIRLQSCRGDVKVEKLSFR